MCRRTSYGETNCQVNILQLPLHYTSTDKRFEYRYVNYAMHRVRMLKYYGVIPYIVFDGGLLPSKMGTEGDREKCGIPFISISSSRYIDRMRVPTGGEMMHWRKETLFWQRETQLKRGNVLSKLSMSLLLWLINSSR